MMTDETNAVDVTFLMPCLNEERTLPQCIDWAHEALAQLACHGLTGEILISDNGSTDGGVALAQSRGCRVVHCPVKGYGSALIFGMRNARGRYVVMGDSDASYDFREAVAMVLKLREGYELCMGNRFAGEIKPGAMPWKNRRIGNPALSGILNLFFHSGLSDAHCGLRALTKDAFNRLHLSSPGMEFASEMVVKAALLELKRTEIPITLHKDGRDRPPHLRPFGDGWRHLKFLFMFSPLWLYFIPSIVLMALSVTIFALLLATGRGEPFTFGPFWIGDHWMILAGGLFSIGHSGLIFGLAAMAYSVRGGFRRLTPTQEFFYNLVTIENSILVGTATFLVGFALFIFIVVIWSGSGFGFYGVSRIREMVLSTTLMAAGIQTAFGGFLVALMRERRLFDRGREWSGKAEGAMPMDSTRAAEPGAKFGVR